MIFPCPKRKRTTTPATIERKAKEGRGQGHGSEYLPWLTIRDVPSQGLSTREQGWKTGRVHHFLSQQELRYFYILEWSLAVIDIREQYPLPLEHTLEIAERLKIKHPTDPKTKESVVMTTDFLIDVRMNGATELKARTVKLAKDLDSKRAIEKLQIERTYWQELGTDWGIVTENEIPESLASNVRWVHKARDLSNAPNINPNILSQVERRLIKQIDQSRKPLAHVALTVDDQMGLEPGTSLWVVRHLIANRYWLVDMNIAIDTGKPAAAKRMRRKPGYSEVERGWPAEARLQAVQTIANYIEPLPIHTELERRFSRMIRNGYMPRNPISAEWKKQVRAGFPGIDWEQADENYMPIIRSTAAGFHIIGTSGVGKSTAVESVLSLYPQVIVHTEYNGYSFDRAQLVWLKLECPYDGSLKGLCLNFFQAIDQILETRYYQKFGNSRRTIDELIPNMAYLAAVLGLGVFVVDEIQRLSEAKSGGAARMLNFFVQLANTIGVPVVLVGTFKALPLVTREFALARRGSGQGDLIWSHFAKDEIWDFFIEGLWDYQWTNIQTPLTPALSRALYDESQGIVDIAVKLYMITQWSVIGGEEELITPGLIRHVASECLQSTKPILEALRLKDYQKLSTISDIHPPIANLNEYLQQATGRVTLEGTLNTLRNQRKAEQYIAGDDPSSNSVRIAAWLVEAGFAPSVARECAVKALVRYGSETDLKLAMQEAILLAAKVTDEKEDDQPSAKPSSEKSCKRNAPPVFPSGDLRGIIEQGKKRGIPAYEALKETGVIKPAGEFLAV